MTTTAKTAEALAAQPGCIRTADEVRSRLETLADNYRSVGAEIHPSTGESWMSVGAIQGLADDLTRWLTATNEPPPIWTGWVHHEPATAPPTMPGAYEAVAHAFWLGR